MDNWRTMVPVHNSLDFPRWIEFFDSGVLNQNGIYSWLSFKDQYVPIKEPW